MKRFISHKKIKVPRYKLWLARLIFGILVFSLSVMFLKKIPLVNNYNFLKRELGIKDSSSIWPYVLGFKDIESKSVNKNVDNIEELVVSNPDPKVYIYNTYQTYKYKLNFYNSYSISPIITNSNLILKEYLKKWGINSIVETTSVVKTLKDNNLNYQDSYKGSRILLENRFRENASLKYFVDIGMSNEEYDKTTIEVDNKKYAKIEFIIGTNNSKYLENKKVVEDIKNKLDNEILEIAKVTEVGGDNTEGVFNQDYSSNLIVLNLGGSENTIEEVNNSLEVFAKVLGEYIGGYL